MQMNSTQCSVLLFGLAIGAAIGVGCKKEHDARNSRIPVLPQQGILIALGRALNKVTNTYNLEQKPYDLSAWVDKSGEWVFVFNFLPTLPDGQIIAIVSTNEVRVNSL